MPSRVLDPKRLAAALAAQRAELLRAGVAGSHVTDASLGTAGEDVVATARTLMLDVVIAHDHGCVDSASRRLAVRAGAELLSRRAPGRSVELRVPPDAAVQCVPGPPHTRGTPAAVVETDPVTFLRLATGAARWADEVAAGRVRRSGQRTDLSPWLPVVAPDAR